MARKAAEKRERGITILEVAMAVACAVVIIGAGYGLLGGVGGASAETMRGFDNLRESMDAMDRLRGDLQTARILSIAPDAASLTYALPLAVGNGETVVNQLGELQWGVVDSEGEHPGGSCTLSFTLDRQVSEADEGRDLNGDGDETDLFDLGHLVKTSARGHRMPFPKIPLLLKSGDHGGDVTGDGRADPLFAASRTGLISVQLAQRDGDELRVRTIRARPIEMGDSK